MIALCNLNKFEDLPTHPLSGIVFRTDFTAWWEKCVDIISIWSVTVGRIKRTIEKFNLDNSVQIVTPF